MMAAQVQRRQILVPTGRVDGWIESREYTKKLGAFLPACPLLSTIFMRPRDWAKMRCKLIWTRNILVYPAVGEVFKTGTDVVGGFSRVGPVNRPEEQKGGRWIFPGPCIPEEAIGKKATGLFVTPDEVEVQADKIVIHADPSNIAILSNFIDEWNAFSKYGTLGWPDPQTGVPLATKAPDRTSMRARLFRSKNAGVEPIAYQVTGFGESDGFCDVHAVDNPSHAVSVALVKSVSPSLNMQGLAADAAAILAHVHLQLVLPKRAHEMLVLLATAATALSQKNAKPAK